MKVYNQLKDLSLQIIFRIHPRNINLSKLYPNTQQFVYLKALISYKSKDALWALSALKGVAKSLANI